MGKLEGKVAFITGAARGQGRSHAVTLAAEGADIIAIDACADIKTAQYAMATGEDLKETVRLVEALGRRIVAVKADVREPEALKEAVSGGVDELGRLDVVSANAGICTLQEWDQVTPEIWQETIDINLTGVWNTCVAAIPHLIAAGGGSIIITSSTAGRKGLPFFAPYVAAKTGIVGVAKSLANELGQQNIRVNTVHPTGVNTDMLGGLGGMQAIIEHHPSVGSLYENTLPVETIDAVDISNAILWLASDDAKYVTGVELSVDAGCTIR
jgi:SDR family mycofactocin-dependent oxidoreductase